LLFVGAIVELSRVADGAEGAKERGRQQVSVFGKRGGEEEEEGRAMEEERFLPVRSPRRRYDGFTRSGRAERQTKTLENRSKREASAEENDETKKTTNLSSGSR
jgi:hypothetical protein